MPGSIRSSTTRSGVCASNSSSAVAPSSVAAHVEAGVRQLELDEPGDRRVVLDDQDVGFAHRASPESRPARRADVRATRPR